MSRHEESDAFSPLEKLVLDYASALTATPSRATDEQVEALLGHYSKEQLVELTAMIAWENFRARFNRGFDVADQGFAKDGVCALPESHPALSG